MERKDINILDYLFLLYRARWYIILNFFIVCSVAAVISLILPVYYRSTATLLPPSESDQTFGFSQAMSMLPVNIRLGGMGTPSDIYIGIMKSTTVANAMVEKFDLINVYGAKDRDAAVKTLRGLTDISLSKEGLLNVSIQDRDRERVAVMANSYWTMLDSINRDISQRSSAEQVAFIDEMLRKNALAITEAENNLREFQRRTNVISPFHQQRVALSVTAELEADIMQKETLLGEYRAKSFSENHPLVKDILQSIRIRQEQLSNLRFGGNQRGNESLFVPLQETPDLVIEYSELSRRQEIVTQLEQYLLQQREEMKIQQANSTSTVLVLDKGLVPTRKYRPKRTLIVAIAGAASLFFSIVSIVTIEFFNRLTELTPENREKVKRLARFMRIQT